MVRADVLALAPPPPPVPGPRPTPPVRVACCGIDREANHALFLALTEQAGSGRTHDRHLGRDPRVRRRGLARLGRVPARAQPHWCRRRSRWAFRTGGMYRGNRFAEMIERARVDEALQDGRTARFVVGDGSPLVDLLAWGRRISTAARSTRRGCSSSSCTSRARGASRCRSVGAVHPQGSRGLAAQRLRPRAPARAGRARADRRAIRRSVMERIRSQGRVLEAWENEALLGRLQDGYKQVAAVLRKRRIEVVELDAARSRRRPGGGGDRSRLPAPGVEEGSRRPEVDLTKAPAAANLRCRGRHATRGQEVTDERFPDLLQAERASSIEEHGLIHFHLDQLERALSDLDPAQRAARRCSAPSPCASTASRSVSTSTSARRRTADSCRGSSTPCRRPKATSAASARSTPDSGEALEKARAIARRGDPGRGVGAEGRAGPFPRHDARARARGRRSW